MECRVKSRARATEYRKAALTRRNIEIARSSKGSQVRVVDTEGQTLRAGPLRHSAPNHPNPRSNIAPRLIIARHEGNRLAVQAALAHDAGTTVSRGVAARCLCRGLHALDDAEIRAGEIVARAGGEPSHAIYILREARHRLDGWLYSPARGVRFRFENKLRRRPLSSQLALRNL